MKKKLMAIIAAAAMVVTMVPSMVFAGVNTTADAQAALDASEANINVELADGTYDQLKLSCGIGVRSTGNGTSSDPYIETRTLNSVTVSGGTNAKVKGFTVETGFRVHYKSPTYYATQKYVIGTLKFKGLTFTNVVNIHDPNGNLHIDEVVFENVTFDMDGVTNSGVAHFIAGAGNYDKITFKNCDFVNCENINNPIYIDSRSADDVDITVEGCTFDAAAYNAIQISGNGSKYTGKISIVDNEISNTVNRGIRISRVGSGAAVVIKNNVLEDAADGAGEFVKFEVESGAVVEFAGNTFDGKNIKAHAAENGVLVYKKDEVCDNHAWNEGVVTKEPTADAEGVKTFTCTACGAEKTEAIAKLPEKSPNTGDNNMAPFAVAGLALAAMAAAVATRRRTN